MTTYVRRGDLWVSEKRGLISLGRNIRRVPVPVAGGGGGGSPPAGVLFHADWSTATGKSDSALLDDSKSPHFDSHGGSGPNFADVLEVVPTSGVAGTWPAGMTNCLRVMRFNEGNPGNYHFLFVGNNTPLPTMSIGQTHYWRVYFLCAFPDSEPDYTGFSSHPIQMPFGSNVIEPVNFYPRSTSNMLWEMYFGNGYTPQTNNPQHYNWILGTFAGDKPAKFTVLRVEWAISRVSTSGFVYDYRMYNSSNVLLYNSDGSSGATAVKNNVGSGQDTLASYASTVWGGNIVDTTSLAIGTEGGFQGYSLPVYFYFGGLCLSNVTWCGPYSGGM